MQVSARFKPVPFGKSARRLSPNPTPVANHDNTIVSVGGRTKLGHGLRIRSAFLVRGRALVIDLGLGDKELDAARVRPIRYLSQGRPPPWHVTEAVEVISLIDAEPGVVNPELEGVIAAELTLAVVEQGIRPVLVSCRVVEGPVPSEH